MFKEYQKYLIKKFLLKYLYLCIIFFILIVVLGILEEISFFKNSDNRIFLPYILTLMNAPSNLFEIFPFILLLSTQLFFFDLFNNDELNLLKYNGLKNTKIIKNIFYISLLIGLFNILIFYNISSVLKFNYSSIKNKLSTDNKYLAMVSKSGLWIKDEINDKKIITKSVSINENILSDVIITEFNENYELIRVIKSSNVNIKNKEWLIYNPIINSDNFSETTKEKIRLETSFDYKKINSLFNNISTFNLNSLIKHLKDYKNLGYSTDELLIHLYKIITMPIFYGVLTILASIIMINYNKNSSLIISISKGILISVLIYYLIFIFNLMGSNGKLPVYLAISFPIMIITAISTIGLLTINEK